MAEAENLPYFTYNRADDEDVNSGSPWSEQDDADLRYMIQRNRGVAGIALHLCRSEREVRDHARHLGFELPRTTGLSRRRSAKRPA